MRFLATIIATLLVAFPFASGATTYYLDDTGSDAADGLTEATAWLTFNKAWQTVACGDTVRVLPGTYYRATTFNKNRTCTAVSRLIFEAYNPADRPILVGGSPVTGWTQIPGKSIWYHQLTAATDRIPNWVYQVKAGVYKRMRHAQYPNVSNEDRPYQQTDLLTITTGATVSDTLYFPADLENLDCDDCGFQALGSSDDEMLLREGGATYHCAVTSYDPATNLVFFVSSCQPLKGDATGNEFTGYRSCRLLDADGEWCTETVAGVSTLYVRPFAGDDPSAVSIILPHYRNFINAATSAASGDFLTLDGLVFRDYDNYAVDTTPASETCSICDEVITGGSLKGVIFKNLENSYGSSLVFNGGFLAGGFENDPLIENFVCDRLEARCIGFGRSHPTSVVTFRNVTASNIIGDPFSFGTGGTGTAGDDYTLAGEIILDNVDVDHCEVHWAGHNDCFQTHLVKKATVKNSTWNRMETPLPIPTDPTSQIGWITGSQTLIFQDNVMRDGLIGLNASGSVTFKTSTVTNFRFRRVNDTVIGPASAYPTEEIFIGNTVIGAFRAAAHKCSVPGVTGCDPAQDFFSPVSNLPFKVVYGCNDFSGATLEIPPNDASNVYINTNFNRAISADPLFSLPATQKYESDWLQANWNNSAYRLNGSIHTTVPIPALTDTDSEAWPDCWDNCVNTSNATQWDVDADGYGNLCDADFNNDGVVGGPDFFKLKDCYGQSIPATDPSCDQTDLNGDAVVGGPDYFVLKAAYGGSPGPSCCGTSGGESAMSDEGSAPQSNNQTVTVP